MPAAGGGVDNRDGVETDIPDLAEQDVKVYLVDPRDKKPCILELSDIFREQMALQKIAVKRVWCDSKGKNENGYFTPNST